MLEWIEMNISVTVRVAIEVSYFVLDGGLHILFIERASFPHNIHKKS